MNKKSEICKNSAKIFSVKMSLLKFVSTIFYQIFIFDQMIAL